MSETVVKIMKFLKKSEAPDVRIVGRVPTVQTFPGPGLELPQHSRVQPALLHAAHHRHTPGPGT